MKLPPKHAGPATGLLFAVFNQPFLSRSFASTFKAAALVLLLINGGFLYGQLTTFEYSDTACSGGVGAINVTSFVQPALPAGDVKLTFWAQGDLDASSEYIDIYSENGGYIGRYDDNPVQCGVYDSISFVVPRDSFAAWAGDGVVTLRNEFSSGTGHCDPEECVFVVAEYVSITSTNDAGVTGINQNSLVCAGTEPVEVEVRNLGSNQIASLDVHWSIDEVQQSSASISGTLDTLGGLGSNSELVNLGNITYGPGGSYDLKVWTSQPNGNVDTLNYNDTLQLTVTVALNGTYTIGGSDPDYNSFSSAVNDLLNKGVCGPVVFSVREGNYTEQIEIGEIPGAKASNHVTFRSESGDSSAVTLSYSSSSADNYIVRLNEADHITFRQLSFEPDHSSYGRCVEILGDSDSLSFYNNRFKGISTSSSSTQRALVYYDNSSSEHQIYRNNRFEEGSYGIEYNADNMTRNFKLVNNHFIDQYYRVLYLADVAHAVVDSNYVSTGSSYSNFYGLTLNNCDSSLSVQNNYLHGARGGYGISVEYCDMYSERGLIANNFVHIGESTYDAQGIEVYSGSQHDVVYNTVRIESDNSGNEAFYHYQTDDIKVLNNNFSTNTGYAYYSSSTSDIAESDHNNIYSNTDIAYWGGARTTLADLQTASGKDGSSLSENPYFLNDTGYVVAQVSLNEGGTPFARVSLDIEGEVRDGSAPDIGADEFVPTGTDAGVIALEVPEKPFAPGSQPVKALIKNYGGSSLSSVALQWEKNDTLQSAVSWSGTLASGDTTWVSLGSVDFLSGKLNNFKVYTEAPNGGADNLAVNDTFSRGNIVAALGGSYTIGGTDPAFADFTEATRALNLGGVYDSVVFNVRSGTYDEQITISEILRTDTAHSVTFQSEVGDSSAVTLQYVTGSNDNHVVRLNGPSFLTFKEMTLYANSNYNDGRVIVIDSGSTYISVQNAVIRSNSYSYSTTDKALVYSSNSFADEHLTFDRVHFLYGSYGIYLDGSYSTSETDIAITHCHFDQQYQRGIFTEYSKDLVFRDNLVEAGADASSSYYGACFYSLDHGVLERNRIFSHEYGSYGLYLYYASGTSSDPVLVANNFVQVGGTEADYGIRLYGSQYVDLVHNSVLVTGGSTGSAALANGYSNSNIKLYNNILQNIAGGYAIYSDATYGIENSDHNNLYTSGNQLGNWSGDISDLSTWIATTNLDSNSINVEVQFADTTDLHSTTSNLVGAGIPFTAVPLDIDLEPRDPVAPTIGADEFGIPPDDAALTAVQGPVLPFVAGVSDVKVQLFNNGADTLTSTTIQWEVNGAAQPAFSWSGQLASGETLDSVRIGSFDFEFDTVYSIKAWTELPNGNTDAQASNDTVLVEGLYAALQGLYTIGGTTPDFSDFAEALQALDQRGIGGWVTFNVRDGNYNEQVALTEILGASSQDTVVFQSESGDSAAVKIYYESGSENHVVLLDGTDYVTFKDVSIQNTDTYYGRALVMENGANHNGFVGVAFASEAITTNNTRMTVAYMDGSEANNHNTFRECRLSGGSYGLYMDGPNSDFARGNRVMNSEFFGQYAYGIYSYDQENYQLLENKVVINTPYYIAYGIYARDSEKGEIRRNEIHSTRYGLYLEDFNGTQSHPSVAANNFVYITGSDEGYGIHAESGEYGKVVHNSVLVTNSNAQTSAFYDDNNSNFEVLNNIFQNEGGGYAVEYGYTYTGTWSDHNNLYSTGPFLGEWGSTQVADLAAWKSTAQQDTGSISIDAAFHSATDLHTDAAGLNAKALPLAYVTEDFDGDPRDVQVPDIGADEFGPKPNDAAMFAFDGPTAPFADGNNTVYVSLLNNGSDTLKTVTIEWRVNGVAQSTFSWSGALPSGEVEDSVAVGTYSFAPGTYHNVEAWTVLPNGVADEDASNDTLVETGLHPALVGAYTVGGSNPDFADFTETANALHAGGVIGWVRFDVRDGVYQEQLTLNEITGVDANDTILYQSEGRDSSLVRLEHNGSSGSEHTLLLNGTDHISFRDITFKGGNSSYAQVVVLDGKSENTNFTNCTFAIPYSSSYSTTASGLYVTSTDSTSGLRVSNSQFVNGDYGFRGLGHSSEERGLVLRNNIFRDQENTALYLQNFEAPIITGNDISSEETSSSYDGIYLTSVEGGLEVTENKVYVANNGQGMYITGFSGSSARGLIANNFISSGDKSSGSQETFEVRSSNDLDIFYNNVLNDSASGYAAYFYYNSGLDVRNNNFVHLGDGYALYSNNTSQFTSLDHNNLYTTGPDLVYGNGVRSSISVWQSYSGLDGNSITVNPIYTSAKDLHVSFSGLDSAATPVAEVTRDIDGDIRDAAFPDIGADEVSFYPADIMADALIAPVSGCGLGDSLQVTVQLTNNGAEAKTNFDVVLVLDGDTTIGAMAAALPGGNSVSYTFAPYFDFSAAADYDFKVWTELAEDVNRANDTAKSTITNFPAPVVSLTSDTSICVGNSVTLTAGGGTNYSWSNGGTGSSISVSPSAATKYVVTVTDGNGCTAKDSLMVHVSSAEDSVYVTATTCDSAQAGLHTDVYMNRGGCDSIVYTDVAYIPNASGSLADVVICEGESATIFGSSQTEAAVYYDTLAAANGCDSIISQELVVLEIDSVGTGTTVICQGESADIFGQTETAAGVYYNTLTASTGCDSVVYEELVVNPIDTVSAGTASICQGDSASVFGSYRKSGGTYYQVTTASTGCDSVLVFTLDVNPVYDQSLSADICEGESIMLGGGLQTTSGVYVDSLQSVAGCDSVVITTLAVWSLDTTTSSVNMVIGDSIFAGGAYQTTDGTYSDTHSDIHGCDSVHFTSVKFFPPERYFTYTGQQHFTNSIVDPQVGDGYSTFDFAVTYYDTNGLMPPFGFPRVILDYEGNGSYNNTKDRNIIMTEADVNDTSVTDGKVYVASITSLPEGQDYEALVQVIENGDEVIFGPFDYPDVLAQPDLEIFANDISFSDPNPDTSSSLTISATVTNTSDYPANNFVVNLQSRYDTTAVYPDITVSSLAPRSSTTLNWTITTPPDPAWVPMRVTVDYTDVLIESNELDNMAQRAYINGDFEVAGDIVIDANVSPQSQCSAPNNRIRVYGYAYYIETAVPLQDSTVAGAEVTIERGGATYTGLTNSRGYFSISNIPAPVTPSDYDLDIEVTDFTLTGDTTESFTILSCPCTLPDLRPRLNLPDYTIVVGGSISGTAKVQNQGCDSAGASVMTISQDGGLPLLLSPQSVSELAPNEDHVYNFSNLTFNSVGTYTICVEADETEIVTESNESNNRICRTIRVLPDLPDIVAYSGPYRDRYLCEAPNPGFTVRNSGAVPTGPFECKVVVKQSGTAVDTFYHHVNNINANRNYGFSIPYTYPSEGSYSFDLYCDTVTATGGEVAETNEGNNTGTYSLDILECKPDLVISTCHNLTVQPEDPPTATDFVDYEVTVRNAGNATATAPIDVRFTEINGTVIDTVINQDLQPGQSQLVHVRSAFVASGTTSLLAQADPDNKIVEFYENNNSQSDELCWEFEPVEKCGRDFWDKTYSVFEAAYLSVGVNVDHLYEASSVDVRFEVSGPGISGKQDLGVATITDVDMTCSCPYSASLPTNFAFSQEGVYTFTMTVDPDNVYSECDEGNNVLVRDVNVFNQAPDMRILSQYIEYSDMNPDVGDQVDVNVTYENIGLSNLGDQMELKMLYDNDPVDSIKPVYGLISGDNITYTFPNMDVSNVPGAHVVRAIIDSDFEVTERDELNNEATRALIVGDAANLFFASFEVDNPVPAIGDSIDIRGYVGNNGELTCDADVNFSFVNDQMDTVFIGSVPISDLDPEDSVLVTMPWSVLDSSTTLIGEIVNTSELEFNYEDNIATTEIGAFEVDLVSVDGCAAEENGSLTATVDGGVPPYSYDWSTGAGGSTLNAAPGVYSVTVTDGTGFSVTVSGEIEAIEGSLETLPDVHVCDGDSAVIFGEYRSQPGYYYDTIAGVGACDTLIRQRLYTDPVYVVPREPAYVCAGDTAMIFGEQRWVPGIYRDTLTAASGCDSILMKELQIIPMDTIDLAAFHLCEGDSTFLFGEYRSTGGIYYDTVAFPSEGCPWVNAREIIAHDSYEIDTTMRICEGDSIFLAGEYQDTEGVYVDSLYTSAGCDSVQVVDLKIDSIYNSYELIEICEGDTAMVFNEAVYSDHTSSQWYSTANGCDSVHTVEVQVLPEVTEYMTAEVCEGDSIFLAGDYQTIADTYVDVYQSSNGCDSTVYTTVNLLPSPSTSESVSICQGDSVQTGGSWQTTTGSYVDVYPAANGCDSTVTTNVIVDPVYDLSATADICAGDSIMLGGAWQTTSGTYVDVYQTAQGCDSTINTTLNVLPNASNSVSVAICQGDSVQAGGSWQTTAGSYVDVYQAANGCDSTVTTTVTVDPVYDLNPTAEICAGDSLLLGGVWQKTAGTYIDEFQTAAGCDSIVNTTLNVLPNAANSVSVAICQGDSVQAGGSWQTTAGSYVDVYQASNGCDSTVTTNVTVDPVYDLNVTADICSGDSIMLGGAWQTTAGTYTDVYQTAAGCDSIVSTTLNVLPNATNPVSIAICQGDSVNVGGSWQTTAGSYVDVYQAANGCDSTVTTSVTVNPVYDLNPTADICAGDSLMLGGVWQKTAGTYIDEYQSAAGCDSIINTTLNILPNPTNSVSVAICQGDSVQAGGSWQTMAGSYVDVYAAANGCDSTVTTNVTVDPVYDLNVTADICAGDSIMLGGSWQKTAGTYIDEYQSAAGCDSTINTTLNVLPNVTNSVSVAICQGDSVQAGGSWQTTAGSYVDVYQAANGCDSTVTTTVSVDPVYDLHPTVEICAGDSLMLGGVWQKTAGTYIDEYQSAAGCDSTINTTLNVLPNATNSVSVAICQDDSVQAGGSWQTMAGSYVDVYPAANGCDSTVTTTVTVDPVYDLNVTADICSGDSIMLGGAWQTTAGTYTDVYQTAAGCDSIVSTTLDVLPNVTNSVSVAICQGDSINVGGSWQSTAGSYVDVYQAGNGCDSTVTTTVTVDSVYDLNATAEICAGDSIMLGGAWQTTSGTYVDVYQTAEGCDSTVTTTLNVLPVSSSNASMFICSGDSVLIDGVWQTTAGTYTETFTAVNGCDSVHTTTLSVDPEYDQIVNASICQGDSIWLEGAYQTSSGTYVDSLSTINGCDSIITTNLSIDSVTSINVSASICKGDSIWLEGAYQVSAGTYTDTISGMGGCDSIVATTLNVTTVDTSVSLSNHVLTANATGGATYRWIDCTSGQYIAGETGQSFAPATDGTYACEVTQDGCTDTSSCYVVEGMSLLENGLPGMSYHPNPTKGEVFISLGQVYGELKVSVIDGAGKRLKELKFSNESKVRVDIGEYVDGIYYLHIEADEAREVIKVLKE